MLTVSWCRHTGEEVAASSEEGANCVHGGDIGGIEMAWLIDVVDIQLDGMVDGMWLGWWMGCGWDGGYCWTGWMPNVMLD